jgi:hypothetical protein
MRLGIGVTADVVRPGIILPRGSSVNHAFAAIAGRWIRIDAFSNEGGRAVGGQFRSGLAQRKPPRALDLPILRSSRALRQKQGSGQQGWSLAQFHPVLS